MNIVTHCKHNRVNIEGRHVDSQDFQDNRLSYIDFQASLKSHHARLIWYKNGSVGKVCKSSQFSVQFDSRSVSYITPIIAGKLIQTYKEGNHIEFENKADGTADP